MPYDKNLELPDFKNEKDGTCTYTHNHACNYRFTYERNEPTSKERKDARAFMERGKKEINRCIFFMQNCLKDEKLTGVQQATLKQSIKNDEDLIQALDEAKPSACTIS